jgi:hypothetical protein
MVDRLSVMHPERRLHNYVVVYYDSEAIAKEELAVLQRDSAVMVVTENRPVTPAYWPAQEPYYSNWYPYERDYQWGMLALRTYEAWDITPGWGYVGVVDSGIYTGTAAPSEEFVSSFARQFAFNHLRAPGDPDYRNADEGADPQSPMRGHGTHVAGIIAAKGWNSQGVAGVCMECVLMVQRSYTSVLLGDLSTVIAGIYQASRSGAQVVNLSFVTQENRAKCGSYWGIWCDVTDFAGRRDINLVASAGNYNEPEPRMPAYLDEFIPVGGIMVFQSNTPSNYLYWKPWSTSSTDPGIGTNHGTNYSLSEPQRLVMAPAKDIVSTVFPGYDWDPGTCGSNVFGAFQTSGYGLCSGTSMAAPHVTGIIAAMRSIDPLKSSYLVRQQLLSSSAVPYMQTWPYSTFSAWEMNVARWGRGVPNMRMALDTMVTGNASRLTPLFSLYNPGGEDYFYTAIPQMAVAAVNGQLLPNSGNMAYDSYVPVGTAVGGYSFPDLPMTTPAAQVWVFTTPANPQEPSNSLVPLYRFSLRCAACPNPNHVDHGYSTSVAEFSIFLGAGYRYDGIEGFLYPPSGPQHAGTERVYRALNPNRLDYAMFPESLWNPMMAEGYTQYITLLGYAYPNSGVKPVI